jgi:hypothetical protein
LRAKLKAAGNQFSAALCLCCAAAAAVAAAWCLQCDRRPFLTPNTELQFDLLTALLSKYPPLAAAAAAFLLWSIDCCQALQGPASTQGGAACQVE